MDLRITKVKERLQKRIGDCSHGKEVGARCFCDTISCPEKDCKAVSLKLTSIASHYYKKHPDLTPNLKLKAFPLSDFVCDHCRQSFEEANPYSFAESSQGLIDEYTFCGGCAREFDKVREISLSRKKVKGSLGVPVKIKKNMSRIKKIKKPVAVKTKKALVKSRSVRSKENTLAYFDCVKGQVANPLNDRVKITAMCHYCKHNKGKVMVAKQEKKDQLVNKVAEDYLTFGQSLGSLLHANIACNCKK